MNIQYYEEIVLLSQSRLIEQGVMKEEGKKDNLANGFPQRISSCLTFAMVESVVENLNNKS